MSGILERSQDLATVIHEDYEVVLLAQVGVSPTPRHFNGSSLTIWRAINGRSNLQGIVEEVARTYRLQSDEVRGAVTEFIAHLIAIGLIHERPD